MTSRLTQQLARASGIGVLALSSPFLLGQDEVMLDETVVTASKLDETVPEMAASVARVDADRIEKTQLRDVNDAYRLMGNVRAPQGADSGFVIRGINAESPDAENASGNQSPLSVISVDGVVLTQQGVRRGQTGMWDVASVEVLRGPQSTLQGKNSLAGSVHINTNDPIFEWKGALRSTFGSYNTHEWAGMLNVPINDIIAMRFTAEWSERDSFIHYPSLHNFPRYQDFKTASSLQLRGKILFEPDSLPFSSKLTYSYVNRSPSQSAAYGPNASALVDSYFDHLWLSPSGNQQVRSVINHSVAWENSYEFSDTLRLTSLSTYTRTGLAVDELDGDKVRDDVEQDGTQEIRLNWDDDWGRAILGVYGSRATAESTQSQIERVRKNVAIFGEADLAVGDHWHVIGGGRLSYDSFDFSSTVASSQSEETVFLPKAGLRYEFAPEHTLALTFQRGYQTGGSGIDTSGESFIFDPSYTWHTEISYRNRFLDDRLTLSANAFYSTWKDQQIVLRTADPVTFVISERVINAAESSFYGGEVELSYASSDNLHFYGSVGILSTNFDRFGFKIDPAIAATLGVPSQMDYAGYDFPEAPNLSFSLGFDWQFGDGFFIAGDMSYTGSYYSPVLFAPLGSGIGGISVQVPQDETVEVDPYVTVNLSAGYESENWKFTVFVNNLLDEEYVLGEFPGASPGASGLEFHDGNLATIGAPRMMGVSFEWSF